MSHHNHDIDLSQLASEQRVALLATLSIVTFVGVIELIGGHETTSLGLFSEALHQFTDAFAVVIALIAHSMTHNGGGNDRAERISAMINAATLLIITVYLAMRGIQRIVTPEPVHSQGMLFVATRCADSSNMAP